MKSLPPKPPRSAGKSSFGLIDSVKLLNELQLLNGTAFLDVACGAGDYSTALSEIAGENGMVYAIDLWKEGIEILAKRAASKGITNIKACVGDIRSRLPCEDNEIDVCLMATILHEITDDNAFVRTLNEISRVVKRNGFLAVVEFKKIKESPGPRFHVRLSPRAVAEMVSPFGFVNKHLCEIGSSIYLAIFELVED